MKYDEIKDYCDKYKIEYLLDYSTSKLITFKVGGNADMVVFPSSKNEICELVDIAKNNNYKFYIIGCGSNILFSDNGFDGIVISTKKLNKIHIENNILTAECGTGISVCAKKALENSLSDMEFTYGIPGSVGGAVFMNASAFGGYISEIILSNKIYDSEKNKVYEISKEESSFGNKSSIFTFNKNLILLETRFLLKKGNAEEIKKAMDGYLSKRALTQPLDMPSAGSVFKRPVSGYASKLIDEAGLKGSYVGGATVSEKHAGFIVNSGSATCNDILSLIKKIKKTVKDKNGIELQEEVIYIE